MGLRFAFAGAALAAVMGVLASPFAAARAAPQPLGLMASRGPVPLACLAGECAAEISAFCLEQARGIPDPGTPYRLAAGRLTLIAIAADGRIQRTDAAPLVSLVVERGYSSVRVALPARVLERMGAVRAAIEVGERVTLVAAPIAGDPDPLDAAEAAAVTGPLRRLAARFIDDEGTAADAARLTNGLINDLPENDRVSPETARKLWRARRESADVAPAARARADAMVERCQVKVAKGRFFSLRHCLEVAHDQEMLRLNQRYWRAVLGS